MSKSAFAKKGLIFGGINYAFNFILPFIARTIIIYELGDSYVGLGSLFSSLINVLNVTELGLGSSLAFLLYKPLVDKDTDKVKAILNFARKCFLVIGIIILLIGLLLIPALNFLIASDIPSDLNIYIIYLIVLTNSIISYVTFSYKRILFSADQRYDIEVNISTFALILQYVLQIVVLVAFKNYYLYTAMTIIATIVNNLLCQIVSKKRYPEYFASGKMTKEDIAVVKEKVGGAFLTKLSNTIYLSVDNIIISAILGLALLGRYNNYYLIITSLVSAFAIVHNTLRPIIGNSIVVEDKESIFKKFIIFDYMYLWLSIFCFVCLITLYQDFIMVWLNNEEYLLSIITMLLLSSMFLVGRLSCVIGIFIDALGMWKNTKWVYLAAAIFNLVFNIVFAYIWGINGIIISTIISSFFITLIGTGYCLFKYYFDDKGMFGKYLKSTIFTLCNGAIIAVGMYLAFDLWNVDNILFLVLKGAAVAACFVVLFFMLNFYNKYFKMSLAFGIKFIKGDKKS